MIKGRLLSLLDLRILVITQNSKPYDAARSVLQPKRKAHYQVWLTMWNTGIDLDLMFDAICF